MGSYAFFLLFFQMKYHVTLMVHDPVAILSEPIDFRATSSYIRFINIWNCNNSCNNLLYLAELLVQRLRFRPFLQIP